MGGLDDGTRPLRYVFDEGHHLFDAADGAFGAHLSGVEASDLRRWLLGAEGRRGSRARGLERRVSDLLGEDVEAQNALAPPARPRAAAALAQLADAAGRRHGAGTRRGVPRPGAPAGARALGRRRPGFRPGMRRAAAQSRTDRGRRSAGRGAGEDAGSRCAACARRCAPSSKARPTSSTRASARASRAWRARSTNRCELTLEAWRAMLRGLHNDARSSLRRLVRASSACSSANTTSACTVTISIRPSRS